MTPTSQSRLVWAHVAVFWGLVAFVLWHALRETPATRTPRSFEPSPLPAGDDVGDRVMKALRALGGPGKVWIAEPGVISTTIVLGKAQEIEFGAGSWAVTARPGIVLGDASAVEGAGVHRTPVVQKGTAAGPLILSAEFDALSSRTESEVERRPTNDPELKSFDGGIKGATVRGVRLTGGRENDDPSDVGVKIYGYWWSL